MKIHKYGVVILSEGPVRVEGWQVQREPEDPKDATDEQLLLGFAIHWAKGRFQAALADASMDVFRKLAEKKSEANCTSVPPKCVKHGETMILSFVDRPNSPPGNAWVCVSCIEERQNNALPDTA